VQRQIGDLNQAAIAAERAIERAQDPTDALLLRGEIALQAQNPNSAYSHAQAVLKSHPEHPAALQLLAQALQGLHRPEEALAALEKALPLVDKPLPLLLKRASLLKAANGLEPAIEAWQDLANHYPNEAEVLAPLAEALMEAGRVQAAIDVTKQALQAEEGALASDVQANLHFLLGRQARRTGQLDQAIYHLNQAVQHAPQHIEAYMELGHTHHERRQYSQALVAYRQAIQVSGKDSRPYYHAALALKESKDYAGAEKMLRRAAELAPTDVTIHRLLGAVVALNLVHSPRLTSQE
jgi:tetratricopeptide (TPR) repeat protein